MMEICGDNRFEIIARAKADLLEGTNIETDEAEMAVIDNILFRCWQMGWLDRYDRKTEPTISKMEQVDKDINVRSKDCTTCKHAGEVYEDPCELCYRHSNYEPKDEPQTENLFTDKDGDVWEWRGDAWYCISGDEPQTDCAWR